VSFGCPRAGHPRPIGRFIGEGGAKIPAGHAEAGTKDKENASTEAGSELTAGGALGGTRTPNLLIRSYWRAPAGLIDVQRMRHVDGRRCG
jgi:hypothetical protein